MIAVLLVGLLATQSHKGIDIHIYALPGWSRLKEIVDHDCHFSENEFASSFSLVVSFFKSLLLSLIWAAQWLNFPRVYFLDFPLFCLPFFKAIMLFPPYQSPRNQLAVLHRLFGSGPHVIWKSYTHYGYRVGHLEVYNKFHLHQILNPSGKTIYFYSVWHLHHCYGYITSRRQHATYCTAQHITIIRLQVRLPVCWFTTPLYTRTHVVCCTTSG